MPQTSGNAKGGAKRQAEYRQGLLKIELPRRDVHDLALIRRRLYELTTTPAFIQPMDLEFVLSIVDGLYRRVENARKNSGFTWNTANAPAEDGLG